MPKLPSDTHASFLQLDLLKIGLATRSEPALPARKFEFTEIQNNNKNSFIDQPDIWTGKPEYEVFQSKLNTRICV